MKEEIALKEKINLVEKEMATLADRFVEFERLSADMEDVKAELKALKLYLGRQFPNFMKELPELIEKVQA